MATALPSKAPRTVATHKLRGFIPTFSDQAHHQPLFNTLTATASDLQAELSNGKIKSTQVVEEYHRSIIAHNSVLNAVWELAPGAMQRAEELDLLREKGQFLGPLHGIPILVKDNINLDPSFGLGTSGGAVALVDSVPASSATVIEKLLEAGIIILGKTTMSEMAYFKGSNIRCGWSAAAGHAQSAYSPDGSSSGSAVAVSAGFAPIALGTETSGSLVCPATRAALFTIKSTVGIVPGKGIMPLSTNFDIAGPLTKSPRDAADLLTILVDPTKTQVPDGGYASALPGGWKDIKVGTLDPEFWAMPHSAIKYVEDATAQMNSEVRAVYSKIKELAKSYHGNISKLPSAKPFELPDGSDALSEAFTFDLEQDLDCFLQELTTSKVRSLKELVRWNFDHADVALTAEYPNQDALVAAIEVDHTGKSRKEIAAYTKAAGAKFLDLFTEYDVDVIIAPTDSPLFLFSSAGAFPTATLPISTLAFNGRPFGLTIAARPHNEAVLVTVMSAWESTFPARKTPEAYLTLEPID
ncbi:putative amidase [Lachnellula arida]|uniref:Putative amidase n=1 Tax=Lachnellula arida TaxID=1316785 RepID=A0A8T9BH80_9HELO|nr:putative amidase [Lachnellula arida]